MRRAFQGCLLAGVAVLTGCAGDASQRTAPDDAPPAARGAPPAGSAAAAPVRMPAAQVSRPSWSGPPAGPPLAGAEFGSLYALAYFPAPAGDGLVRADSAAALYAGALPGYGLYTFVIGGSDPAADGAAPALYPELLRTIETYVIDEPPDGSDAGAAGVHVFLVPVHPRAATGTLAERATPAASEAMRGALARQLRLHGRSELADRLEHGRGPFLITSPRPVLLPAEAAAPRLVADLSTLGPEYMYPVVDAYDRPIPSASLGREQSLEAIRQRLLEILPDRSVDAGAAAPSSTAWVELVGGGQAAAPAAALQNGAGAGRLAAADTAIESAVHGAL